MMLNLDSKCHHSVICKFCAHESDLKSLIGQEVEHKKTFNQKKEWLTGPWEKKEKEKAIVEEDCPAEGCNSTRMYFNTAQLRSVDEGQTVFYECVECGHTYSVNT